METCTLIVIVNDACRFFDLKRNLDTNGLNAACESCVFLSNVQRLFQGHVLRLCLAETKILAGFSRNNVETCLQAILFEDMQQT